MQATTTETITYRARRWDVLLSLGNAMRRGFIRSFEALDGGKFRVVLENGNDVELTTREAGLLAWGMELPASVLYERGVLSVNDIFPTQEECSALGRQYHF